MLAFLYFQNNTFFKNLLRELNEVIKNALYIVDAP